MSVSAPAARRKLRRQIRISDVEVRTTIPEALARKLDRLSAFECSTTAATARRLLARSVEHEFAQLETR